MTKPRNFAARHPDQVTFSVRLPRDLVEDLDAAARDLGISRSGLIVRLLQAGRAFDQGAGDFLQALGLDEMLQKAVQKAVDQATSRASGTRQVSEANGSRAGSGRKRGDS